MRIYPRRGVCLTEKADENQETNSSQQRRRQVGALASNGGQNCLGEEEAGPFPGEKSRQALAGGKGDNQATYGGKLAYPTYFLGHVGGDAHGKLIVEALESGGVCVDHLSVLGNVHTGHVVVMLQSDRQNSIIIVGEANMCNWPQSLLDEHLELLRSFGIVLLQREIPDSFNIQVAKA
ncbi:hypothetical protein L484_023392 [Morus notabilis]|uniref:Carbohydrate kinase PfkB domain-containing protein n=1 Tax=Morus notabilis TaxID=981085 RepID=W9SG40_9ROSA|nr:hypothetical protein L484_023392 [Morus notabilis]